MFNPDNVTRSYQFLRNSESWDVAMGHRFPGQGLPSGFTDDNTAEMMAVVVQTATAAVGKKAAGCMYIILNVTHVAGCMYIILNVTHVAGCMYIIFNVTHVAGILLVMKCDLFYSVSHQIFSRGSDRYMLAHCSHYFDGVKQGILTPMT